MGVPMIHAVTDELRPAPRTSARHKGHCLHCPDPIWPGDAIARDVSTGRWVHELCLVVLAPRVVAPCVVEATRPGTCNRCGVSYPRGTAIVSRNNKWVHPWCAQR